MSVKKAKTIILIEKLRFIYSEIFKISSKYGVSTIDELDSLFAKGKLTEKAAGEDFFTLDNLIGEKKTLEKKLKMYSIDKSQIWTNFQDLLELQKPSFRI